ncbi:MAG: hypothetical protein LUQ65_09545 [Candidatus Helarchaeota archaeon]|nr:hypothetical protein [Candidatus Helarchaeota archaeon]
MKQEKEFVTSDLYLAAFLSIHLNRFPSFKVENDPLPLCYTDDKEIKLKGDEE